MKNIAARRKMPRSDNDSILSILLKKKIIMLPFMIS